MPTLTHTSTKNIISALILIVGEVFEAKNSGDAMVSDDAWQTKARLAFQSAFNYCN